MQTNDRPFNVNGQHWPATFTRRRFLSRSAGVSAGLLLTPVLVGGAPAEQLGVREWGYRFAGHIGLRKLGDTYSDYVEFLKKDGRAEWLRWAEALEVSMIIMKLGGFTNIARSEVHGGDGTLFYMAQSYALPFNACAPFITAGRFTGAASEGPTMMGLALAARQVADPQEARRLLFATKQIQKSIGTFDKGYTQTEKFSTSAGRAEVNYEVREYDPNQRVGTGVVKVVAVRDNIGVGRQEVALNSAYDVRFNLA